MSGFVPGAVDYAQLLTSLGSADFRELRPAQDAALACYSAGHTTTGDLAIELPTGGGKSPIALLVCEAWRREGATVAVLTGNKALARQMESEGHRLVVPVVRLEGEGVTACDCHSPDPWPGSADTVAAGVRPQWNRFGR
jgi:superfamily II DNA or RNA helicase